MGHLAPKISSSIHVSLQKYVFSLITSCNHINFCSNVVLDANDNWRYHRYVKFMSNYDSITLFLQDNGENGLTAS